MILSTNIVWKKTVSWAEELKKFSQNKLFANEKKIHMRATTTIDDT